MTSTFVKTIGSREQPLTPRRAAAYLQEHTLADDEQMTIRLGEEGLFREKLREPIRAMVGLPSGAKPQTGHGDIDQLLESIIERELVMRFFSDFRNVNAWWDGMEVLNRARAFVGSPATIEQNFDIIPLDRNVPRMAQDAPQAAPPGSASPTSSDAAERPLQRIAMANPPSRRIDVASFAQS